MPFSWLALVLSQVALLPSVLAKKRVWNRKYPICLTLAAAQQCVEEDQGSEVTEAKDERAEKQVEKEEDQITTLYLFGRTGREKEEWYQHFMLASKTKICHEESKPGTEVNQLLLIVQIHKSKKAIFFYEYCSQC